MGVKEKAGELAEEIKTTKEFNQLKQAKATIDRYPDLKNEIKDLLQRQAEIVSSNKGSNSAEVEHAFMELSKRFKELSKIPEVDTMLMANKAFYDMITQIYKEIGETLDREMQF